MQKTTKFLIIGGLVLLAVATSLFVANPKNAEAAFTCTTNSDCGQDGFVGEQFCQGDKNLFGQYVTYTCNNSGTTYANCTSSKTPQLVRTCNADQKCKQGIWFIGCATDTETGGGSGNTGYVNNGSYDYLRCSGNSVYWFDRYGNQKSLYQTCGYNQTCNNDSCVTNTNTNTNTQPTNCVAHTSKGCFNNSVYWYNSCGTMQEVYQTCNGTCQEGQCSTSGTGTTGTGGGGTTTTGGGATTASYITVKTKENLVVTLLARKESGSPEFTKNISASANEKINFLMVVKNTSDKSMDNTLVKVELPDTIKYDGNLKIDTIGSLENIVSGINLGSIAKGVSKMVSFSGVVSNEATQTDAKITVTITSGKITDSDSLMVNVESAQVASENNNSNIAGLTSSFIAKFLKGWFIWGLLLLILIFLFIIIFRKLSSNQ